ncbi:MAG: primosomal protein N' [Gammaproteobacteria bacterium]|nr:primosomal protein N' [Gammaproteobacteria bacterium]
MLTNTNNTKSQKFTPKFIPKFTPKFTIQVALPVPLRNSFTYLPLDNTGLADYHIGARVKVPFGKRVLIGLISGLITQSHKLNKLNKLESDKSIKLKKILSLLDNQPVLTNEIIDLVNFSANYYHCPIGEAYFACLPRMIKQGEELYKYTNKQLFLNTDSSFIKNQKKFSPAQSKLIDLLDNNPQGLSIFSLDKLAIKKATIDTLVKNNLIYVKDLCKSNNISQTNEKNCLKQQLLILNNEQQIAKNKILDQTDNLQKFTSFLLYGITGSGKTEIYLHLIYNILLENKQILVLIPEISLTPQTIERFKKRFNTKIAVINSKVGGTNKTKDWLEAKDGRAGIILGTRSAIFTPIKNLGLIIIDEEHDQSFKQQDGFKYNARDLAVIRAKSRNIPVLLGSATPSIETMSNVINNKYFLLTLYKRAGSATLPRIRLLNTKQKKLTSGLSQELIGLIKQKLERKEQILLFLNRRGFTPVIKCHTCNWGAICDRCNIYYTAHKSENILLCHYCDSRKKLFTSCPECHNPELSSYGVGTEQVEEYINQIFPGYHCLRIDRDTTRKKNEMAEHIDKIKANKVDILLGTQMLAKGHHFPNVTLVAILDCDASLFSTDFRAPEHLIQLLVQVSGRAGRADNTSEVVIQTMQPEHPLLQDILHKDYWTIAQELYQIRKQAQLPPCAHWGLIKAESHELNKTVEFLEKIKTVLNNIELNAVKVMGPLLAPRLKQAGLYRGQLLLSCSNRMTLQAKITEFFDKIATTKSLNTIRWSIDIDPYEMT